MTLGMLCCVSLLLAIICYCRMELHARRSIIWKRQKAQEWHALLEAFRVTETLHCTTAQTATAALDARIAAAEATIRLLTHRVEELQQDVTTARAVALRRAMRPVPPPLEEAL